MILSKLTVTPLLYLCGALLAGLIATGIRASVLSDRLEAAASVVIAQHNSHVAELKTVETERDAWKKAAGDYATAVAAHQSVTAALRAELERVQGETKRRDAAAREAIAAARAEAQDADRTLARMAAQFQAQSRQPDCAHALAAVATACPAMRDY